MTDRFVLFSDASPASDEARGMLDREGVSYVIVYGRTSDQELFFEDQDAFEVYDGLPGIQRFLRYYRRANDIRQSIAMPRSNGVH